MRKKLLKKVFAAVFSVALLFFFTTVYAENIDPDDDDSQYAWGRI